MKIIPGGAAGGAPSGKAGALVASHNRFGYYFRNYVIPTNPNTIRQQAVRTLFSTLVQLWIDTLTPAQRTAWDTYGANTPITDRLGQTIFLTGQNQYIRSNVPRLQLGGARIDAAPIIFDTGNPVTSIQVLTDLTLDTIGINLAATGLATTANISGTASDDGDVLFYLGAPVNATRNFFKGPYQLTKAIAIAAAAADVDFTDLFTSLLSDNGNPAVGETRGVRFRVMYDDGRLSDAYDILAPVVADSV